MYITIENVPDVANVAEEQFQALVQLAPAVTFPAKVYLQASSLRNKDELIQELEGAQATPEQLQLQQELAALEMEEKRASVEKIRAEIRKLGADALKASVEADMAALPQGVITEPRIESSASVPPPELTGEMELQQPPPGISGDMGAINGIG